MGAQYRSQEYWETQRMWGMKSLKIFAAFIIITTNTSLLAEQVSSARAEKVAVNWMNEQAGAEFSGIRNRRYIIEQPDTLFYVFEFSPKGFIIIAADDIAIPVVMYSPDGSFSDDIPPGFEEMLSRRKQELLAAKKISTISTSTTAAQWNNYSRERGSFQKTIVSDTVAPMLSVTWSQGFPYNKFCPTCDSGGSGGRTYAGCVALAYAQLMKYHNWPVNGTGSYEYVYMPYGRIYANFEATTYDWQNMSNKITPASPSANIDAVATLIYHCGVAVHMMYGPGGSGAETPDIRNALVKYFKYSNAAVVITKSNKADSVAYSDEEWTTLLKNELKNKRPFIYRGQNASGWGGHAFVIDGYKGDYFDVNFGWGGSFNGYYYLNNLTPYTYNFNYANQAILHIQPQRVVKALMPIDKATNQPTAFTLSWMYAGTSVTGDFTVQLALDSSMTKIEKEYTTSVMSVHLTRLLEGNRYYWRVISTTNFREKDTSAVFSFTTILPGKSALYQNFPNPFNAQTTIRFDIANTEHVSIKVYSITGQEVATLVDEVLEPKAYRIPWNANNLASGVYYYKILTDTFTASKKLVFIK